MIGKTISYYKILEKLSGGTKGINCKAQDTKLRCTVTIKFLLPEFSFDKIRFVNESQVAIR